MGRIIFRSPLNLTDEECELLFEAAVLEWGSNGNDVFEYNWPGFRRALYDTIFPEIEDDSTRGSSET